MNTTDLTNCDREQIQHITYVQGHGAFVAITPLDLVIHYASENVGDFFRTTETVHHYIGRKLQDLISSDLAKSIQSMIRGGHTGHLKHPEFDIFVFLLHDNIFAVEFERVDASERSETVESVLNEYIYKMHESETLEKLSTEACRAVRKLTGMERVMLYRFYPPTMYGEVIGEDKSAEAHAFMGHRFPATDIPKPARDLYLRNQVRYIFDSEEKDYEVVPKITGKREPLNMSDSRLRGVSRIHLEYLRNMGVRTSLSFAIIVEGRLWGLIACHNSKPILVNHSIRSLGETIASAYALGASLIEKIRTQAAELEFFHQMYALFDSVKQSDRPLSQLFREGPSVLKLFNCSGMAFLSSDRSEFFGMTPMHEDLQKLHHHLISLFDKDNRTTLLTDSIGSYFPELASFKDQASGILAVRINEVSDKVFVLMRPEYLETVYWGGDPRKNIEARNYGGTINPRISFETWSEVVKNVSRPWESFELKGIETFRNVFFDALINKDELAHELRNRHLSPKT